MKISKQERLRILSKIKKTPTCWLWTGFILKPRGRYKGGYGRLSFKGKTWQAHRLVYTILKGKIRDGMVLDHLCRVRNCVNPKHLDQCTRLENIARGESPGRSGSQHHNSKLMEKDVDRITVLLKKGVSIKKLAKDYDVCLKTIYNIKNKTSWLDHFRFKEETK